MVIDILLSGSLLLLTQYRKCPNNVDPVGIYFRSTLAWEFVGNRGSLGNGDIFEQLPYFTIPYPSSFPHQDTEAKVHVHPVPDPRRPVAALPLIHRPPNRPKAESEKDPNPNHPNKKDPDPSRFHHPLLVAQRRSHLAEAKEEEEYLANWKNLNLILIHSELNGLNPLILNVYFFQ
jgi:hypothetical protein